MSGPVTRSDTPVDDPHASPGAHTFERFPSRDGAVGGVPVRRALPKRQRRTIGPWCFVDHFGPVAPGSAMQVGPHPHIGLHTVTWLLEGKVLHHDSLGHEQLIRPGQLNLMVAGNGISHAEETPPGAGAAQHGVQLWLAQPDATRSGAPDFEHHPELPVWEQGEWSTTVLVGELGAHRSPARTDSPLVGAALSASGAGSVTVPLDAAFEHGVVVLDGTAEIDGRVVEPGELVYLGLDRHELDVAARDGAEVLLVGGEPFTEEVVMWWNFVARDHQEIAAARADWEAASTRFGTSASRLERIEAPAFI